MPTSNKDKSFAEEMGQSVDEVKMSSSALDNAIDWMQHNLDPAEVFTQDQLESWAENNGWVKSE